eukprot:2354992-Prymnesium_polylepis.1
MGVTDCTHPTYYPRQLARRAQGPWGHGCGWREQRRACRKAWVMARIQSHAAAAQAARCRFWKGGRFGQRARSAAFFCSACDRAERP